MALLVHFHSEERSENAAAQAPERPAPGGAGRLCGGCGRRVGVRGAGEAIAEAAWVLPQRFGEEAFVGLHGQGDRRCAGYFGNGRQLQGQPGPGAAAADR